MAVRNDPDRGPREPLVRKRTSFALWIIGMFVLLLIGLGVVAWLGYLDLGIFEEETAGTEGAVTVDEITEDAEALYGETVTVSGEIGDVLAPRAFVIGGADVLLQDGLLVILDERAEVPAELDVEDEAALEGEAVQVTGIVGEFNIREFEDRAGFVFDEDEFEEYDELPVVLATSVEVVE